MQIEQLGPYRIGPRLGKGGMGSVYEATDGNGGQRVAVKALTPQLAAAEGFRERFEAEIESLKKLQHDGIVRLLGYGEDNGVLFYSMELVDGPSLEQELNAGRRFDWNETLGIAIQICRALKHAHDHGVVHRDIKPANLLLAKGDRVKIADFGIARLFGSTQLTTAGGILGTADYMSPEQVDGRPVTDRCDQYALGCVMYALLAGRPPFRAKTMPEMLQLQRYADPEPVRRYAPQTPEVVERLIGQLLRKEPGDRFPNVLVLSRHMEAMQKALSRPAKAPGVDPKQADFYLTDAGATAAPVTDATLAQNPALLERLETTDSGVYDAPTLADDGQGAASAAAGTRAAGAKGVSPPVAPTGAAAPGARESRFTTVDEDARRGARVQAERWALALQLAALVATLGMFAAIGWWLLKPVTADELYSALSDAWQDAPGDLRPVASEMEEFLARFPDDPRAAQVRTHAEELELQKLERKRRVQTRLGEGAEVHLAEMVYAAAVALAEAEPARAAQMLQDLLALYPATEDEAVRQYLVLARRKLEGLQAELDRQSAEQLPQLLERLRTAKGLESVDMDRAEQMYRALVRLYGDQPWAAPVVADAQQRLEELQDRAAPPSRAQQSPATSARADSPPADSPPAP